MWSCSWNRHRAGVKAVTLGAVVAGISTPAVTTWATTPRLVLVPQTVPSTMLVSVECCLLCTSKPQPHSRSHSSIPIPSTSDMERCLAYLVSTTTAKIFSEDSSLTICGLLNTALCLAGNYNQTGGAGGAGGAGGGGGGTAGTYGGNNMSGSGGGGGGGMGGGGFGNNMGGSGNNMGGNPNYTAF